MSAIRPYEPTSTHLDTARERDVDMQLDADEREDSREKLEADVQKRFTHSTSTAMWPPSANKTTDWLSVSMETVLVWLDRQAAITEREIASKGIADRCASCSLRDGLYLAMDAKEGLRQSLDETIAERNALQAQVDELTKERDRALADAKTQRNNFEIATKAREHWRELATKSKGEVDDLRQSLDETIEERNELQAKLDDFDGDCYCGATVVQWYEHSVRLQGRLDEMEQTRMCLPVDADGVPIRVGDLLETSEYNGRRFHCNGFCYETALAESRWTIAMSYDNETGTTEFVSAHSCRHVQPDTVEAELAKFLTACGDDDPHHYDEQIAEFAERIRKAVE